MPRRKQDKPQHWEEDDNMKTEQLMPNTVSHREANLNSQQILDGKLKDNLKFENSAVSNTNQDVDIEEDKLGNLKSCGEWQQQRDEEDLDGGEQEAEAAVIGNQEWLNVKATLSSLQQQMSILRHQHCKFMQLFATENHEVGSQSATENSAETDPTSLSKPVAEEQQSENVLLPPKSPNGHAEVWKTSGETEQEIDGVEKMNDMVNEDSESGEQSPSLCSSWPYNDEQGEPESFDCTECSAVLPSPELLKIHIFTTHRRADREKEATSVADGTNKDEALDLPTYSTGGSALKGSSSFPSLPPSYQSIINDLSNDSLEEYMEIQKPENTHLEHLVKNMDGTVTDPNQCLICKRILSCKSALMMHYRTHTGERPFKCKLCSRAFTTKGNLKTHMGVHRAKPPLRLLHSCMVCNKQFANALVLNQHMKMHSEEASRKRTIDVQGSACGEEIKRQRLSINSESSFKEEPSSDNAFFHAADLAKKASAAADFHHLVAAGGVPPPPGFPFDFGSIPPIPYHFRYAEAFTRQLEQLNQYSLFNPGMVPSKPPTGIFSTPGGLNGPRTAPLPYPAVTSAPTTITRTNSTVEQTEHNGHLKQPDMQNEDNDKSSITSDDKLSTDLDRQLVTSPKSEQSWDSNETTSNSVGMKLDPPPGTTCDICMKTFACRSALEIHYRSHTKHRPFKCDLCDKAFTTRGNMKQHTLTHKADYMQWNSSDKALSLPPPSPVISDVTPLSDEKRSSGRHQCSICLKHFSSASAVQIHFRTHTGDRPFKCTVCSKAFTTKGNLKVHMGTHMWNGSSVPSMNQTSHNATQANNESIEREITPVTSPGHNNPMMLNNGYGWNPFNQNPLMKGSLFGNPAAALMANYSGLFLPPGIAPPIPEEAGGRPWLWQTICHICNKECHNPASLEAHQKTHIVNENGTSKPVTA